MQIENDTSVQNNSSKVKCHKIVRRSTRHSQFFDSEYLPNIIRYKSSNKARENGHFLNKELLSLFNHRAIESPQHRLTNSHALYIS